MKPYCRFSVPGIPRPGGSKSGFPFIRSVEIPAPGQRFSFQSEREIKDFIRRYVKIGISMAESGEHTAEWRKAVVMAARMCNLDRPEKGFEYLLKLDFFMPRPQAHFNSKGELRPLAPKRPKTTPDVLKLARAVEDALTGLAWHDDAEVTIERLTKVYGRKPGVIVTVWRQAPGDAHKPAKRQKELLT